MSREHEGKPVVVITGASRGIGLGVACYLAADGVPLVLTARGEARLDQVAVALREQGAKVEPCAADAADEPAMRRVFERAAALGPLGGALHNAGVIEPITAIRDIDVAAFEAHLRTNVTGVLVGLKQALAHRTGGQPLRIVNVSSGAAVHGYRGWAAYCASKAAVNLLSEVAAAEAASETSVVAVAPGIIETRMQRAIRATPAEHFPDVAKFHELHRTGVLLHPVDAAVPLGWFLREAPLELSGRFIDARDEGWQQRASAPDDSVLQRAKHWFDRLEAEA